IPSSPRSVKAEVPEAIDLICRRALSRYPEARYATAAEMQRDIEAYLKGVPDPPTNSELGAIVSSLFQDKRAEVKAVLQRQFTTTTDAARPLMTIPVSESNPSRLSVPSRSSQRPTLVMQGEPAPEPHRWRRLALLGGIVGISGMIGVTVWARSNRV